MKLFKGNYCQKNYLLFFKSVVRFGSLKGYFFTFSLVLLYHIENREDTIGFYKEIPLVIFYFMKYTINRNLNTKKPRWAKASSI